MKLNKYEKASEYILFHMVKNQNVIQYYFNNLSYLPNEIDRELASKIVLYYKKYKNFNLSDFISYLEDNNELIKRVMYIDELKYSENYTLEEIDAYFSSIKEYIKKEEIKKLQNKMKNEMFVFFSKLDPSDVYWFIGSVNIESEIVIDDIDGV